MYRKKMTLFLFLFFFCLIVFLIVPLIISMSYGNTPILNRNYLFTRDIIVSNNPKLKDSGISMLNYDIYTWNEIKTYIINKQITFLHVLRDIVVVIATAILAVLLDRLIARLFPRYWQRK